MFVDLISTDNSHSETFVALMKLLTKFSSAAIVVHFFPKTGTIFGKDVYDINVITWTK